MVIFHHSQAALCEQSVAHRRHDELWEDTSHPHCALALLKPATDLSALEFFNAMKANNEMTVWSYELAARSDGLCSWWYIYNRKTDSEYFSSKWSVHDNVKWDWLWDPHKTPVEVLSPRTVFSTICFFIRGAVVVCCDSIHSCMHARPAFMWMYILWKFYIMIYMAPKCLEALM